MESLAQLCKKLVKRAVPGGVVACALLQASTAWANLQPGSLYDARSAGMAGGGVAYNDSGAASFHNPALMDKIGKSATTLTLAPFINDVTAPTPNTTGGLTQTSTGYQFTPLGQLGTSWRVHDRVVVGANAFVVAGNSLKYTNVPTSLPACNGGTCSQSIQFAQIELQIPVSFKIIDGLSIGAAYRMTFGTLSGDLWQAGGAGLAEYKVSATATNFAGVQAGVHYQPIPELEFGVNYRNNVSLNWSGTLDVNGQDAGSAAAGLLLGKFNYVAPHAISVGAATHLLEQALTINVEYRDFLYSKANGGLEGAGTAAHWQDSWTILAGGEYKVTPMVPVRLGLSYSAEATTDATATFLSVPPGNALAITVGSGVDLGEWTADLAVEYAWWSHTVPAGNPAPGNYKLSSVEIFLSGTYKF